MAPAGRPSIPSTPVLVSLTVVVVALALPLALVGLSTVTGWDAVQDGVLEEYRFLLAALAVASPFAAPYGVALGVATLPLAARTGVGYGSGAADGSVRRLLDHVAGAVLYTGLATVAAGVALWTAVRFAGPRAVLESLGTVHGPAALLGGGLLVAGTFLGGELYRRHDQDDVGDSWSVVISAVYAAAILPSPFFALSLLDWLLAPGDLPGVALLAPL